MNVVQLTVGNSSYKNTHGVGEEEGEVMAWCWIEEIPLLRAGNCVVGTTRSSPLGTLDVQQTKRIG